MKSEIRLISKEELNDFWEIVVMADSDLYLSREYKDRRVNWFLTILDNYKQFNYYGLFKDGKMLGGMALIDFKLTLHTTQVNAGGVGMIKVDLLHKKQKVCKEMITYFIEQNRDNGSNIIMLYPFNVEFYKNMGFGYGTKVHQFKIKPQNFPKCTRENLAYADQGYKQEILDCYSRYAQKTNGFIDKTWFSTNEMFNSDTRIVAYRKNNKILGYIQFRFQKVKTEYEYLSDIVIEEFIYENSDALKELCTFIHYQSDQINRVIINTPDDNFNYILSDPINGYNGSFGGDYLESNVTGVGVMYRVTNVIGIFNDLKEHNFNDVDYTLKLTINDSFYEKNNRSNIIEFKNGSIVKCFEENESTNNTFDCEVVLEISDFSSLITGAIDFRTLYNLGLANVSNSNYLEIINETFKFDQKPKCITHF
jgi:predicted acetyltransferase